MVVTASRKTDNRQILDSESCLITKEGRLFGRIAQRFGRNFAVEMRVDNE